MPKNKPCRSITCCKGGNTMLIQHKNKQVFEVIDKYTDTAGKRIWILCNLESGLFSNIIDKQLSEYHIYEEEY
jgi:hypothetical protein